MAFLAVFWNAKAQDHTFTRIAIGTRSEITSLKIFSDGRGVCLAERVFVFDSLRWKPIHLNEPGNITHIYAHSPDEFWYSVNLETSTSAVFHYSSGQVRQLHSPFANEVTAIHFSCRDTGLFASFSEIRLLTSSGFKPLEPLPGKNQTVKIHMVSPEHFYALTRDGILFQYFHGTYNRMHVPERVADIAFFSPTEAFILGSENIFRLVSGSVTKFISMDAKSGYVNIAATDSTSGWLGGYGGEVARFIRQEINPYFFPENKYLRVYCRLEMPEIWLHGAMGTLYCNTSDNLERFRPDTPGFSRHKLLDMGINVDDEYGVALGDVNGDGKDDIYTVCIFNPNKLYINVLNEKTGINPESGFPEEALKRGATGMGYPATAAIHSKLSLGVAMADIDNDGDQDLYVCSLAGRNKLLINKGNGYFRDVSHQKYRACENVNRSNAAAFADVDLDGDLDLFLTSEEGSNKLYLNNGAGYFHDITDAAGLGSESGGMCAAFSDFDHDGDPDLCVTFWYGKNKLYRNESGNGTVRFNDISNQSPLIDPVAGKSNGVLFFDANRDGWNDLFIASRNSPNRMYINDLKGSFCDATGKYFTDTILLSNGAAVADMNLDGYEDLFIANVGKNFFYENVQGSKFAEMGSLYGLDGHGYSTGCAVTDIDNNGSPDLYVSNYIGANSSLYINRLGVRQSVTFFLRGIRSNRDATGTKIWLYSVDSITGDTSLAGFREMSCGEGYGSSNGKRVILGTGSCNYMFARIKFPLNPDTLVIRNLISGSVHEIKEYRGFQSLQYASARWFQKTAADRELLTELGKIFVVIVIGAGYLYVTHKGNRRMRLIRQAGSALVFIMFLVMNGVLMNQPLAIIFFIPLLVVLVCMTLLHFITDRILLKRITEREKHEIRERIARDLHDDLASTLGTISIYADALNAAQSSISEPRLGNITTKISGLTYAAKQSITDIIWMTSPRNDNLQGMIDKICQMMLTACSDAAINFRNEIDIPLVPIAVRESLRNHLFLIMKEAFNNILKHSKATRISFRVSASEDMVEIILKDDGLGFDPVKLSEPQFPGNGIINMRRRAAESGITLTLESVPGSGTELSIVFKI